MDLYRFTMNLRLPFAIALLALISSGCSIQIGTSARPMGPQRLESGPGRPPQMDPSVRQQVVQRELVEIHEGAEHRGPGSGGRENGRENGREGGSFEDLHIGVRAHPVPGPSGTYRLLVSVERKSSGQSRGERREEQDHMNLPPLEVSMGGEPARAEAGNIRLSFRVVEESGRPVGLYELGWKSPEGEGMTRSGRLLLDSPGRPGGPNGEPRPGRGPKPGKDGPGS